MNEAEVMRDKIRAILANHDGENLSPKLLELEQLQERWKVHIASDGLSLEDKLAIERRIMEQLGSHQMRPIVNFRRMQGSRPVASPRGKQPYGLEINRLAIPDVKHLIVVASGKGGVGKSTVSANLSVALAKAGARVGLLDADIYGPSAPTMFGVTGPLAVNEKNQLVPVQSFGVKIASFGFLTDALHPVVWRGPMISKALMELCYDVAWGELDYLVVDLPPGTGDIQLTLVERLPIHGAIIVSTPQDVALLDAHKALSMFIKLEVPVLGVVENMAYFHCPNCNHRSPIFGENGGESFSKMRGVDLLARIPLAAEVRLTSDNGTPLSADERSSFYAIYRELARSVEDRVDH